MCINKHILNIITIYVKYSISILYFYIYERPQLSTRRRHMFDKVSNFGVGELSEITATSIEQTVDIVKIRTQLKSEANAESFTPFKRLVTFIRKDSAILTHAVYCSLRLALCFNMSDHLRTKKEEPPFCY